ncbi:Uncharacterized protein TCM_021311 [Theobroma cacao]|uniref:Uncharacterized protein n=1 Tax=Theobroma cacao TaxID=3641 RepID=A0A061ENT1_THECC|nr:Uncharacterized protein TCM_021311 [Theobroma cacao]
MDTRDGGASNPNGSHGKPVLLVTHLPFALACLILVARCTLERTLIFEACGFGPSLCLTGHRLMLTALIVTVYLKNEKCWENKILSPGGRITLLRSVLSSIPIYLLQVLKPPVNVIEKIERLFNSFLWGGSTECKRIHWASWNNSTFPCTEGGLDIRSLKDIFGAFTTKLWWRFHTCNSIWT